MKLKLVIAMAGGLLATGACAGTPSTQEVPTLAPSPSTNSVSVTSSPVPSVPKKPVTPTHQSTNKSKSTARPTHHTSNVHPGAFCSSAGAHGTYNGKIYTCKGPDRNRWRR